MGRLDNLRVVDPVLTTLAQGFKDPQFIGEALFPVRTVTREAGKIPVFGKESWKLYNTLRAIRANSNVASLGEVTLDTFNLDEHDLAVPLDYREEQESMFDLEAQAVNLARRVLARGLEAEIAALATNTGNYPGGHSVDLSGTAQFNYYTVADAVDPTITINTGKEAIRAATGAEPNTLVLGAATYNALKLHPLLIEKIKYSMKGIVTVDLLREIFDIPNIVVGKSTYVADTGTTFLDLWGDVAILAYVANPGGGGESGVPDLYEPTFGLTLRKEGWPNVDRYTENGGKVRYVRSTDIYLPKIVGSHAGYLIVDTCA